MSPRFFFGEYSNEFSPPGHEWCKDALCLPCLEGELDALTPQEMRSREAALGSQYSVVSTQKKPPARVTVSAAEIARRQQWAAGREERA